jgi:hypothetical protein
MNITLPKARTHAFPLLALFAALALGGILYAPSHVHWRDSAEFVLGASYLDIVHPPGFPTYSALGNLFAHLPFGPLTWRVHLFSVVVTLGCCILCFRILELITPRFALSFPHRLAIFLVSLLPLFGSPAFMRQATTAEAYQLLALFLLAILWCGLRYEKEKDFRFLAGGAFLAGLGLGNHPALLLFAGFGALFFYRAFRGKQLYTLLFCVLFGGAIYLYLPLRAQSSPPLNTGSPTTIERTWNLMSDARDRHLRPVAINTIGSFQEGGLEHQLKVSQQDAENILKETGWYLGPLGMLGLCSALIFLPFRSTVLFALGLGSTMLFFRGWQPDPFVPAFYLLAILCGFALSALVAKSKNSLQIPVFLIIIGVASFAHFSTNLDQLKEGHRHTLADETGRTLLKTLPPHAVFITESSWYIARQLQVVEGVRPDIVLGYIPHFLFPHYFDPASYWIEGNSFLATTPESEQRSPRRTNLGKFVGSATTTNPVFLEAATATNTMFQNASSIQPNGLLKVGKPSIPSEFPPLLIDLGESLQRLPTSYLRRDGSSYLETRALPLADLFLLQGGDGEVVLHGLHKACGAPSDRVCSYMTHLKMVQYALQMKEEEQANELFRELVEARGMTPLARKFFEGTRHN